ncbi:uncharacterized protein CC84DRAFT_960703 [Paraphaeosphaeria sporulosa]|uniref:Uncharacterized protein n=1 Tax=Paraphaeosphaeria sporulosa TaxID=1460663 RepID=A0A177C6I7_9PLEO|nr:uncharacterized protein CC84DRAFT_960703 [Paraphaeosphaeria sporulosa]OAG03145.1 hypothetical protein CC84DRAFT_960703 [Paraphaeosphaeria sporulosa]
MHSYLSSCSCLTFLGLGNSHRPTAFHGRRHLHQYMHFDRLCVHFRVETQPMKLFGGLPQDQSTPRCPLTANILGVRHRRQTLAIGDAGHQAIWALSTRQEGANVIVARSWWLTQLHNWIAYKTSRQSSCPRHHILASLRRSIHSLQQLCCFVLLL